jgi:uncharacterized protein Usg
MLASPQLRLQLEGYGLIRAEILYQLPDAPSILQAFIWQEYNLFFRNFRNSRSFLRSELKNLMPRFTQSRCVTIG